MVSRPRSSLPVRWSVPDVPAEEARALAARLGVPPLVGRLLWLRGLRETLSAVGVPDAPAGRPPGSRAGSPTCRPPRPGSRRRCKTGEKIAICGDYDVDGMTGTALLVRFLRIAGADVTYAIPDRVSDGYGLSVAGVERLDAEGVRLLVTVDNGISALDALERAKALGIDAVVTDHHLPGDRLPPAVALVDPQRTDVAGIAPCSLCGCGLAFKLAWATIELLQKTKRDERLRGFLRDAVGLVALATMADVVPLVGENRVLVAAGLGALSGSTHAGVKALLATAGLSGARLTAEDLVWKLAPRLNAAGRMNRPQHAIDLLSTGRPEHRRDAGGRARVGERRSAAPSRRASWRRRSSRPTRAWAAGGASWSRATAGTAA